MRWLDSDSLFTRSTDTMITKRTLFDLARNNVIGLIYQSFQEYKSTKKRQKLCFSRSKKCEICVCAKIRTMRLSSLLPSFLSLLAASSRRPPLTRTWPNCQSNRRGKKKYLCHRFCCLTLLIFWRLIVSAVLTMSHRPGSCVHHHVYCVWNGWMDAGYLEVLVVQSCPAVPALPHRPSHLGRLDEEVNGWKTVTWISLSPL